LASVISHAVAGVGIGAAFYKPGAPKRVWLLGVACSVFPDIDVVGFHFGVRYGDFWGHRGFTHSLVFAVMLACLAPLALFRKPGLQIRGAALWAYFFLAAASHGVLDAMTDGGLGVAFFSPLDATRYFLPWRPIAVSPIGIARFFGPRGLAVLRSELLWIWLPVLLFAAFCVAWRRLARPSESKT
jgi:inner membrane protein